MVLNDKINLWAQEWAEDNADRDVMQHRSNNPYGENLYMFGPSPAPKGPNPKDVVKAWYDEIKDYNFNNGGFSGATGHFTQRGSYAKAVSSREPAPPNVSVATQVSLGSPGKPLQSSTPRLKLSLPGHSLSAAKAAKAPSHAKDSGATEAMDVTPSPTPRRSSSQEERAPRFSSQSRTSSPRKQHVTRAASAASTEPDQMDGSVVLPCTSTTRPKVLGKVRGLPPKNTDYSRSSDRLADKKTSNTEAMADCEELSAPDTDLEEMEVQTPKQKAKKPVHRGHDVLVQKYKLSYVRGAREDSMFVKEAAKLIFGREDLHGRSVRGAVTSLQGRRGQGGPYSSQVGSSQQ
ncbi:hypothetical protein ISCGN_021533 [Ixodes scapularis]